MRLSKLIEIKKKDMEIKPKIKAIGLATLPHGQVEISKIDKPFPMANHAHVLDMRGIRYNNIPINKIILFSQLV